MQLTTAPFSDVTPWSQQFALSKFGPFVMVGILGVSVASVKSMAWGTDHLSDFTWFSQEMVFTWYLESILYI
jgi:hypothetical protein